MWSPGAVQGTTCKAVGRAVLAIETSIESMNRAGWSNSRPWVTTTLWDHTDLHCQVSLNFCWSVITVENPYTWNKSERVILTFLILVSVKPIQIWATVLEFLWDVTMSFQWHLFHPFQELAPVDIMPLQWKQPCPKQDHVPMGQCHKKNQTSLWK